MCAHLCSARPGYGLGCHEQLDRRKNEPLRSRLLWLAAGRVYTAWGDGAGFGGGIWPSDALPADVIRSQIRRLETLGITPDPSRELEEK